MGTCSLVGLCGVAVAQQPNEPLKDRFMDTVRLGIRYQVQEFHTLNQKLAESCNCDAGQRLRERSLQGITVSVLEPLTGHWSVGGDFGASFGKVMNDSRNYTRYSFVQMRAEGFYHLFDQKTKLRPYLSGGLQLAANSRKALFGLPVGAGLRYSLAKGGTLHVQAAYDGGMGSAIAKSMITNIGFHVPLYRRNKQLEAPLQPSYDELMMAKSVESGSSAVVMTETAAPVQQVSPVVPVQPASIAENKGPEQLLRIVYFDTDKHSLEKTETSKVLSEVYAFLKKHPGSKAYLSGHTDNVLGQGYNIALSKRRVDAVWAWLRANGISSTRIALAHYGKQQPATGNESEGGRSGNRRVEIMVK